MERVRDTHKKEQSKLVSGPWQEVRSTDSDFMARSSRATKVNSLSQCQVAATHPSQCSGRTQFSIFKMLTLYSMISKDSSSPQMFFSKTVMG